MVQISTQYILSQGARSLLQSGHGLVYLQKVGLQEQYYSGNVSSFLLIIVAKY